MRSFFSASVSAISPEPSSCLKRSAPNQAPDAVAAVVGYDFVLSAGVGGVDIVLFAKEEHDVSDLVLKKLGVTPPTN